MKDAAVLGDADAVRHPDLHHLHSSALRLPQPAPSGGRHLSGECLRTLHFCGETGEAILGYHTCLNSIKTLQPH